MLDLQQDVYSAVKSSCRTFPIIVQTRNYADASKLFYRIIDRNTQFVLINND
jgi:hypothetical protein